MTMSLFTLRHIIIRPTNKVQIDYNFAGYLLGTLLFRSLVISLNNSYYNFEPSKRDVFIYYKIMIAPIIHISLAT